MKIVLEDKSYLEISPSNKSDTVIVSIGVKNINNKLIVNSVEISKDNLINLFNQLNANT